MAVTKVQQIQVSGTLVARVSDNVSNVDLLKANRTIEDDLNSLRTQVKLIMGTTAWTDSLSGSQDLADIYAGLRVNGATGVANFQNDVYAATNLFVSGSSVIAGDLTINGTTTTINTTNLEIKDAIIGLGFASGTIQQTAGDRGWIGGISGGQNVATFWDDSASEFVFARTTNSATASLPVTIASYANMRAAIITGSVINATSGFSGSLTKLTNGTSYLIAGSNASITTGSSGAVTINAVPTSPVNSVQYNSAGAFAGDADFTFDGLGGSPNLRLTGSFAQGQISTAFGTYSHAEGYQTFATGAYSHTEGRQTATTNLALYSHAEGYFTVAEANYSHAEGYGSRTVGQYSHAAGEGTIASGSAQNVVGKYNKRSNTDSLFIVGNGSGDGNTLRDDIFLVNTGSVLIGSASLASDTFFYVGTKGTANTALFQGNLLSSGTITGWSGLSGSLTALRDGTSYLIAGSGITITSASNGAVTITNSSTGTNINKGYLLGNSVHIDTGTGVITFGPSGAGFGTLSTATDEFIDVYLNGVYLAYGYDVTTITTTTVTLDSTITSTFTSDDIISITLRNYT